MDELSSTSVSQQMADSPNVPEMKMNSPAEYLDVLLHGEVLVECCTQVSTGLRGIDWPMVSIFLLMVDLGEDITRNSVFESLIFRLFFNGRR